MPDNAASLRLFFALWPEPETARAIWQMSAGLVPKGPGRRLPPEHIHLTLAFLGTVAESRRQCLLQVADSIVAERFTLILDQVGHFPRPQVVWLGTSQPPPRLQVLQQKLVNQLYQFCDYVPETRPFVPHITLWRKVKRVQLPEAVAPTVWSVSRFVLASSRTLASGAEYRIEQTWPLSP